MPIKLLLIVKDLHNLSAVLLTIQAVPFSRAGECIEDQRSCQHSESSFSEVSDSPFLLETIGIEPTTSALQGQRSPN